MGYHAELVTAASGQGGAHHAKFTRDIAMTNLRRHIRSKQQPWDEDPGAVPLSPGHAHHAHHSRAELWPSPGSSVAHCSSYCMAFTIPGKKES